MKCSHVERDLWPRFGHKRCETIVKNNWNRRDEPSAVNKTVSHSLIRSFDFHIKTEFALMCVIPFGKQHVCN